ncbi:MAG: translocation/assembly module TamB domain-containing protein [Nitrospiraceae bacterium]|nr:MAG: translocation/assembly module TamB domain-containing protein [Nitrospiraceae bacterium]
MTETKTRMKKATTIIVSVLAAVGVLFFLLRGPYLSNFIKRALIPVLENATRERVLIDKAVINLFPFYLQAKGFKVFDKEGNRLLWITKSRAYIDLLGLLSNEVRVRNLTLTEPDLRASDRDIERILENLKKSDEGGQGRYRVSLRNIKVTDGNVVLSSEKGGIFTGRGLYLDKLATARASVMTFLMKSGSVRLPNMSEAEGGVRGRILLEDGQIEIQEFSLSSSESTFDAQGKVALSDEGRIKEGLLSVRSKIYASTFNRIFSLQNEKEGMLSFEGDVKLFPRKDSEWPGIELDIKTDSQFYLETLMEIINVHEDIKGKISLQGEIRGAFPHITATGEAKLEEGVLGGFPIDIMKGALTYGDNVLALKDFTGSTYNGTIKGDGNIQLPDGDYTVDGTMSGVDSRQFFHFIKWDAPLPGGKLRGGFQLNHRKGRPLQVAADVAYRNTSKREGDILGRMESASSSLELKDKILHLTDTVISSAHSTIVLDGIIDLHKDTLALNLNLESGDAADLTAPFYEDIAAPLLFRGTAAGPFRDPEIQGTAELREGTIQGIAFNSVRADLTYRVSSLSVNELTILQGEAQSSGSGTIDFRKADGLFSFKDPFYRGKADLEGADAAPLLKAFGVDVPVSGRLSGAASFEGDSREFNSRGRAALSSGAVYGQPLDSAELQYELRPGGVEFTSFRASRNQSAIEGKGTLSFDRQFSFSVSSRQISLRDIALMEGYPAEALFSLEGSGSGALDNPALTFALEIKESGFKDIEGGGGRLEGSVRDGKLDARGKLMEGLVTAEGHAVLSGSVPWKAVVQLNRGRYDYLLTNYLKDIPEDFMFFLEGALELTGEGPRFSMTSRFPSARVGMYGFEFINRGDVLVDFADDEIQIRSFAMTGRHADFSVDGSIKPGAAYGLHLRGNVEVAPLKALHEKIVSLRGESAFDVSVTGPWGNPQLSGEVSVIDTTASLSGFAYIIGPVNGRLFLNRDQFNFENVTAKFAGGTVVLTGAGNLEHLSFRRFFMSSDFSGIRPTLQEGLTCTLDGRLFYDWSEKGGNLTGAVDVRRARYTKRVDWKKLILGVRDVSTRGGKYPAFLADTELNIQVRGSDNILVDNNVARTPLRLDLTLTGRVSQVGLLGRVEASEGTVYFRGNEFTLLEGTSVDFLETHGIQPYFHVLADAYIDDYYVKMILDGPLDDFSLNLSSDPPQSDTDILALLTVGRTAEEGKGIEGGMAAVQATSILAGVLQEPVEEELEYYTGIERFEIEPHTTTGGAFVPMLTIGKRLFEDKLFVIYSTSIGTVEMDIIRLEYKIDRNLSLIGSRNEIGSVGADMKYKFEFR